MAVDLLAVDDKSGGYLYSGRLQYASVGHNLQQLY